MRTAVLFLLAGLVCGPAQAQDFFIEQSAPAHGNTSVPLADTVAFSFNEQVAISTDWNREFVFEPSDSLSFDEVSLCLTFLDVCDEGDDIPRHVRYQVDHESNTDYTWLVYAVQTVGGDPMTEPYTLRYTTAPEIGQGEVSGSVGEPVAMASQPAATRTSLRTLAEGLKRSELGRLVFDPADSTETDAPTQSMNSPGRPGAQFKTIGGNAASDGPFTQILLIDEFSIDENQWLVRSGDALIGSSGAYSLDFVRPGSYVPIAVRYTDGTNTEIDALGFHDPDGDGSPNTVEVDGDEVSGIDVQLFDFPRTTARAQDNLPVATDSAAQYASDQELRWIEAETGIDSSGTAYAWTYRFYSPSKDLETEVVVNPLEVVVDTSEAGEFLTEMDPLPDGFVDSDVALDTVLANGGQEFVDDYPPRNLTTIVSGGNLFWTDPPDPTAEFWRVRFIGVAGSDVETFERLVNIRSGSILPVEMVSFTASVVGETAQLRWSTASETSNAGFEVQHAAGDSASGANWSKLGFVEGAGTTQETQTYRFRTEALEFGTHRFRLKQVDLDGTAHLSDVVTVELRMEAALRLTPPSPNPVRETATLRVGAQQAQSTTVAVYDVLGRKVMTLHDGALPDGQMQTLHLDASRLSSGVYFVRLTAGNRSRTHRLTVME